MLGEKEAQTVTSVRFSHANSVLTVQVVKIEMALSEKSRLLFFFFFSEVGVAGYSDAGAT